MKPIMDAWQNEKDHRQKHLQEMEPLLLQTSWWKMYTAKVKGAVIRAAIRANPRPVILACIEGGPVTCVEQMQMEKIRNEALSDLSTHHYKSIASQDLRI